MTGFDAKTNLLGLVRQQASGVEGAARGWL
jgi:hypothetical protein